MDFFYIKFNSQQNSLGNRLKLDFLFFRNRESLMVNIMNMLMSMSFIIEWQKNLIT